MNNKLDQISHDIYVLTTVVNELAKNSNALDPYIRKSLNSLSERADRQLKRMRQYAVALDEYSSLKSRMDELLADNPNLLSTFSENSKPPFIRNDRA